MAAESLYDRIQRRLDRLGLKAEMASVRAGMGRDGIRNIKRGKSVSPRGRNLKALADVLECSVEDLLGAEKRLPPERAAELRPAVPPPGVVPPPDYVAVPTIAPPPDGGGRFPGEDALLGPPKYFEEELVRSGLGAEPHDLRTMEVEGPSMEPLLHNRDRVLIDTRKVSLAEPGLFVLWDGGGLVCKWVQRVPGSEPAQLRLMSENPRFQPYDIPAERARILGRIVWFARRL